MTAGPLTAVVPAGGLAPPEPALADVELLQALVAIPSVTGSEAAAVAFLQAQARRDGLRVVPDAAGNFVAEAGHGPRLLLVVGHVDTVPGAIPVRVEDGVLWGRGAVDAKGPLAAAYCAARRHLASPDITIRVVGAVDEEGQSRGAKALAHDRAPDWIVVGEPSGAAGLALGYKGMVRGAFTLERPRHHGAHPGPTAVEEAVALWARWSEAFNFADRFDAVQGHLTHVATEGDGLVDRVTARFNVRLPPGMEPQAVEATLRASALEHGARLDVDERVAPALSGKRTDLVGAFLAAIRAQGGQPRLLRKTGTCDFNVLAHRFPGVPIAAYGPGDASLDHTPSERVALGEFLEGIATLDHVVRTLAASAAHALPRVVSVP